MSASASFSHLTARTEAGRNEILEIAKAAKKSGLIHFHKSRKEAQVPDGKMKLSGSINPIDR